MTQGKPGMHHGRCAEGPELCAGTKLFGPSQKQFCRLVVAAIDQEHRPARHAKNVEIRFIVLPRPPERITHLDGLLGRSRGSHERMNAGGEGQGVVQCRLRRGLGNRCVDDGDGFF